MIKEINLFSINIILMLFFTPIQPAKIRIKTKKSNQSILNYIWKNKIFNIKTFSHSLKKAILEGDVELVEIILKNCPKRRRFDLICLDYLKENNTKRTALHLALNNKKRIKMLQTILNYCPKNKQSELILKQNRFGDTVFHNAIIYRDKQTIQTIKGLCSQKTLIKLIFMKNNGGQTALYDAALGGATKMALAIINAYPKNMLIDLLMAKDNLGDTALHVAILNGRTETVKAIINACPKNKLIDLLMAKNNDGSTPLQYAVIGKQEIIVDLIIKTCPKDKQFDLLMAKDNCGGSALSYIDLHKNSKTTDTIINAYEQAIFDLYKIKHKVTHKEIDENFKLKPNTPLYDIRINVQRDRAKSILVNLQKIYKKSHTQELKKTIKQTFSNILAYCIYNINKRHTLSDHKRKLDTYLTAILDKNTSTVIPQHIQDYYNLLMDEPIANKPNYTEKEQADIKENFYATPQELKKDILWAQATRKIWPNKLSNGLRYQKNNMRKAAYNSATTFSEKSLYKPEIEFIYHSNKFTA